MPVTALTAPLVQPTGIGRSKLPSPQPVRFEGKREPNRATSSNMPGFITIAAIVVGAIAAAVLGWWFAGRKSTPNEPAAV